MQIGNGGTSGSLATTSTITNNATLAFNRSNTVTQGTDFAIVISGTGAVTQAGSGSLVLTGANTFTGTITISNGTLEVAGASALGGTTNIIVTTGGTLLLSNTATTDRINNFATMTLAGGTVAISGNIVEGSSPGIGAPTLTAGSVIDWTIATPPRGPAR